MDRLVILGSGKQNSSLDSYSYEFSEASGYPRIMLILDKDQLNSAYKGDTTVFNGDFPRYAGNGWAYNIRFGSRVFRDLKEQLKSSIVHYTTFGLPILSSDPRDIATIHDLFFLHEGDEAYRKFFNVSKGFLERFKKFENVVAPSEHIKKELLEFGFEGKISVIYIAIPEGIQHTGNKVELRRKLNLPLDKKLILSVSSALKRKNLGVVRETMEALGDDYRLVRVGPPVGNSINLSSLSSEQLSDIYNACDAFFFPTLGEGFGKPVIEAFKAGIPVVASNIDVMKEVAGNAAVLVDPDVKGCISGIKECINGRDSYIKRGFERAELFSKEKFRANVTEYYNSILKE